MKKEYIVRGLSYATIALGAIFIYKVYQNYKAIHQANLMDVKLSEEDQKMVDELKKSYISKEEEQKTEEPKEEVVTQEEPKDEEPPVMETVDLPPEKPRFEFVKAEDVEENYKDYELVSLNHYTDLTFADENEDPIDEETFIDIFPVRRYNVRYKREDYHGTKYVVDNEDQLLYIVHENDCTYEESMELYEEELAEGNEYYSDLEDEL